MLQLLFPIHYGKIVYKNIKEMAENTDFHFFCIISQKKQQHLQCYQKSPQ